MVIIIFYAIDYGSKAVSNSFIIKLHLKGHVFLGFPKHDLLSILNM